VSQKKQTPNVSASKEQSALDDETTGRYAYESENEKESENEALSWDVDESDVIRIGESTAAQSETSEPERDKQSAKRRKHVEDKDDVLMHSVEEKSDFVADDDAEEDEIPFPLAQKIIFGLCLLGVVAAVVYIANYFLKFV